MGRVCINDCGAQRSLETKYIELPGAMGNFQLSEGFSYPVIGISWLSPCRTRVKLPSVGPEIELRTSKVLALSPFPGEGEAVR